MLTVAMTANGKVIRQIMTETMHKSDVCNRRQDTTFPSLETERRDQAWVFVLQPNTWLWRIQLFLWVMARYFKRNLHVQSKGHRTPLMPMHTNCIECIDNNKNVKCYQVMARYCTTISYARHFWEGAVASWAVPKTQQVEPSWVLHKWIQSTTMGLSKESNNLSWKDERVWDGQLQDLQ